MIPLHSIAEEAAACRAVWADAAPDAFGWHIHHHVLAERLTEPAMSRIAYVLTEKPKGERALRLRLMRPVRDVAALGVAEEAYDVESTAARRAYDATPTAARKAYAAESIAAWKTYETACVAARAVHDAAIALVHARECPDCPWDSTTIFGGAG